MRLSILRRYKLGLVKPEISLLPTYLPKKSDLHKDKSFLFIMEFTNVIF
jgi:hypothetical protein